MKPIAVLEHFPHEHAGVLGQVLDASGVPWHTVRLHAGEPVPGDPGALAGLVVLGGDMNTDEDDRYPHLAEERALLAASVAAGTPVLGLCLGAQLLAEATGGRVAHGQPEIGFVPVERTAAGRADALLEVFTDGSPTFNAHADVIAVGPDAVVLASSAQTLVHAFRVGPSAWGVQFHPEFEAAMVTGYVQAPGVPAYLRANGWEPEALLAEARRHDASHRRMGAALLERWVTLAVETTAR
jgi:GMP synthase-like glutamine amidotransferase